MLCIVATQESKIAITTAVQFAALTLTNVVSLNNSEQRFDKKCLTGSNTK